MIDLLGLQCCVQIWKDHALTKLSSGAIELIRAGKHNVCISHTKRLKILLKMATPSISVEGRVKRIDGETTLLFKHSTCYIACKPLVYLYYENLWFHLSTALMLGDSFIA